MILNEIFYSFLQNIGHSLRISHADVNKSSITIPIVRHYNFSSNKAISNQISINLVAWALDKPPTGKRTFRPPISRFAPVAIIIPAYNEESGIVETLSSILEQSALPEQIIVVDDYSSDRTSEAAMCFDGVTVLRTPKNIGKGRALNYALQHVNSKYTMTIDADIIFGEKDGINKLVEWMENRQEVSATCTFVLPNKIKTLWEHTRFVEYIFVLSFYKSVQQMYDSIVICGGGFAIYKTEDLRSVGGWPTDTLAEDMELTWLLYENGMHIGYYAETLCFSVEPETIGLLCKQLKRWNNGFFQVLKLKGKNIMKIPALREFVIAALVDSFIGTVFYTVVIFLAITHHDPKMLLYFFALDITLLSIPSFWLAFKIKKATQLAKSLPVYLLVRPIGFIWFYHGFISVFVLRKNIKKWEKGHR